MKSRLNSCAFFLAACFASACTADDGPPGSIAAIQGNGAASPFVGRVVTVEGVVTGDFQDGDADRQNNLGGFFIQSTVPDEDPRTSDGIFVYESRTDVDVGDLVRVEGEVAEFFGETQLQASSVRVLGEGTVEAVELALPVAGVTTNSDGVAIADLEAFEGMWVRLPDTLTVTDTFGLERGGTVLLHHGERAQQFTNANVPNARGFAQHRERLARRSLLLDDGRRDDNVTPVRYLFPFGERTRGLRVGDTLNGLTGVVRYSRDSGESGVENYRLMPVEVPAFIAAEADSDLLQADDGIIRVMSFNTLNFFPTIDAGGAVCGPVRTGCRGADSDRELRRQRGKLITALEKADADVVGLMELENDAQGSLAQLADGLAEVTGEPWRFVDTGTIGNDAIKVGIIYNERTLMPLGNYALLDASVDSDFVDSKNRPVLAQTFAVRDSGGRFTLAVNHLKSKGSDCDELGDPDIGDGQGNCNRTRTRAAQAEARWLAGAPASAGGGNVLIVGDLNAYRREDPLLALTDAGYVNLLDRFVGADAYSFVFRGESGALDHALAAPGLAEKVIGVQEWHINADAPRLLDYNLDHGRNRDYFDAATPFRASDHDPVIIDIRLD